MEAIFGEMMPWPCASTTPLSVQMAKKHKDALQPALPVFTGC